MKNSLLYFAVFLALISASFSFNDTEILWLWENMIQVPIILLITSIILFGVYFYQRKIGHGN